MGCRGSGGGRPGEGGWKGRAGLAGSSGAGEPWAESWRKGAAGDGGKTSCGGKPPEGCAVPGGWVGWRSRTGGEAGARGCATGDCGSCGDAITGVGKAAGGAAESGGRRGGAGVAGASAGASAPGVAGAGTPICCSSSVARGWAEAAGGSTCPDGTVDWGGSEAGAGIVLARGARVGGDTGGQVAAAPGTEDCELAERGAERSSTMMRRLTKRLATQSRTCGWRALRRAARELAGGRGDRGRRRDGRGLGHGDRDRRHGDRGRWQLL
ncbi:hypothetical protein Efla_003392 [Eimeria flavescens]